MAFVKRTWLARLGQGLNKFFVGEKDAQGKQELTNSPDSIAQQGDVISADNLNDLEDRIANAIKGVTGELVWENPNPNSAFAGSSENNITIPIVSDLPSITHRLIAIEYEIEAVSDAYQLGSIGARRFYFNIQKDNDGKFSPFWDILDFNPQGHYYNRRVNFKYIENLMTISHGAGAYDNTTNNYAMVPLRVYLFS